MILDLMKWEENMMEIAKIRVRAQSRFKNRKSARANDIAKFIVTSYCAWEFHIEDKKSFLIKFIYENFEKAWINH